jgi:hypothetical protein
MMSVENVFGTQQSADLLLYNMTNTFLHIIRPNAANVTDLFGNRSLSDVISQVLGKVQSGEISVNSITQIPTILNGTIDTQALLTVLNGCIPFLVCVALGIVLTVGMFIGCICFLPRRLCKGCGASIGKKPEQKNDKVKRIVIAVVILALIALIAGASAGSYLASAELTKQFKLANEPVIPTSNVTIPFFINTIFTSVETLLSYFTNLIQAFAELLNDRIPELFNKLLDIINSELSQLHSQFNTTLSKTSTLLTNLTNSLSAINSTTASLQERATLLTNQQKLLNETLTNISNSARIIISNYTDVSSSLQVDLDSLKTGQAYNFPDLSSSLRNVPNFDALSSEVMNFQLPNASSAIPALRSINETINGVLVLVRSFNLSQILNLGGLFGTSLNLDILHKVGFYVGGAGMTYFPIACTVPVVVIALSLIGLILGTVLPASKDKNPRARAGTVFTLSAGSSFLVSAIFMLITFVFFTVGGLVYYLICPDAIDGTGGLFATLDKLVPVLLNLTGSLFPPFPVTSFINVTNLSFSNIIYVKCKNSQTITDVLFGIINIQQIFDYFLSNSTLFDSLLNNTLSSLIPNSLFQQFDSLTSSLSSSVNFSTFDDLLKQNITQTNLTIVASHMNASNISDLGVLAIQLQHAQDTIVDNMTSNVEQMKMLLNSLKYDFTNSLPVVIGALSNSLRQLLADILSNASSIISHLIAKTVNLLQQELSLVSNATNCRPLYDGIQGLIGAVCTDFFNPFNALWFTFGWCAVLLIPHIIFGIWLGGLYTRKKRNGDDKKKKSEDNADDEQRSTRQEVSEDQEPTSDSQPRSDDQRVPRFSSNQFNPYLQSYLPQYKSPPFGSRLPSTGFDTRLPDLGRPPPLPYRPPYLGMPSLYQPRRLQMYIPQWESARAMYSGLGSYNVPPVGAYSRRIPQQRNVLPLPSYPQVRFRLPPRAAWPTPYEPFGVRPAEAAFSRRRANIYLPNYLPPPHY